MHFPFHTNLHFPSSQTEQVARRQSKPLARATNPAITRAAYICIDCGYIYDGSTAFDKLPNNYKCPVCNAPKRRFKSYSGSGKNDPKSMKARMTDMKQGGSSSSGSDTSGAVAIAVGGAVLLAALYFGLNGVYN